MRTKIAIGLTILLVALAFVLSRPSTPAPPVSLAFTGYSDDGRSALFDLKSHTSGYVSHSHPVIQLPSAGSWTNYCDPIESAMCRLTVGVFDHQSTILSAALPSGQQRWRAAVRCTVYPSDEPTSLRGRVQWLLEVVGLRSATDKTEFTLVTDEFVR